MRGSSEHDSNDGNVLPPELERSFEMKIKLFGAVVLYAHRHHHAVRTDPKSSNKPRVTIRCIQPNCTVRYASLSFPFVNLSLSS